MNKTQSDAIGRRAMEIYLKGGKTFEQACKEAEREFKLREQVPKDIKDLFGGIFGWWKKARSTKP